MKDECIMFRLTDKENEKLMAKAKKQNISYSEYLRRKIEQGIIADKKFQRELEALVENLKTVGDRLNYAATDANINGLKEQHIQVAKEVMVEQMRILQEFGNMLGVTDEAP